MTTRSEDFLDTLLDTLCVRSFQSHQEKVNGFGFGIHWSINDKKEAYHEKDDSFTGSGRSDAHRIDRENMGVIGS
jgi:hypothetical protein